MNVVPLVACEDAVTAALLCGADKLRQQDSGCFMTLECGVCVWDLEVAYETGAAAAA